MSKPSIAALSTPCLLIDEPRLERNLARMQARARRQGVALRPHVKTHRSVSVARRQLALGAVGVTVAKLAEAERFVAAGFEDVRIAYPLVGEDKLRRLLPLLDRAHVSFCLDDPHVAAAASAVLSRFGRRVEVLIEVDCGYGRLGIPWNDPQAGVALAERLAELPGLDPIGVLTHAGQAYHGPEEGETAPEALRRHARDERERTLALAARLSTAEVSIGSTPTCSVEPDPTSDSTSLPRITEIRPGNYAFNDRTQVALGSAGWDDCALTVLATVIHRRRLDAGHWRVIVDAGRKALASDLCRGSAWGGHGALLLESEPRAPHPGAALDALSEEHGWLRIDEALGPVPQVGERVVVVPNHACTAVNTQDRLHLVESERVLEVVPVSARGRSW